MGRAAGQRRGLRAALVLLVVGSSAGCLEGHVQSQQPSGPDVGLPIGVVRPVAVLSAPLSGPVVATVARGDTLTALCFARPSGRPVVQVAGAAEGFVTLDPERPAFDVRFGALSALPGC